MQKILSQQNKLQLESIELGDLGFNENSSSNVGGSAFSSANFHNSHEHGMDIEYSSLIKDSKYFRELVITIMNNHPHKYCFLRCLLGNDIYEYRDEMVSRLENNVSEPRRIEEIVVAGSIPVMAWWGILKVLQEKNKLTYSYRWCCQATEFGYPIPDNLATLARFTPIKHVVVINKLDGIDRREVFILHTPGHLQRVSGFFIIPVEASVDLVAFLPKHDQVARL